MLPAWKRSGEGERRHQASAVAERPCAAIRRHRRGRVESPSSSLLRTVPARFSKVWHPVFRRLFYTGFDEAYFLRRSAALLAILFSLPDLQAAEKQFRTGRILTVEKKFHERVLYYLVNTPVTQDDPYYEISLQLGDTVLLTEFTPRHAADELPDGWQEERRSADESYRQASCVGEAAGWNGTAVVDRETHAWAAQPAAPKPASIRTELNRLLRHHAVSSAIMVSADRLR